MRSIKIVIVDCQSIIREGLSVLLDKQRGMKIIGQVGSIRDACDIVSKTRPDVILMNLNIGLNPSVHHIEEISSCSPASKVLVLTGILDEEANRMAAQRGAMGVVLKDQAASTLVTAIRKVSEG
ncbi:MAG TPA: response regulator transcription factor, partial [Pyrinomonadaceae bacterium]